MPSPAPLQQQAGHRGPSTTGAPPSATPGTDPQRQQQQMGMGGAQMPPPPQQQMGMGGVQMPPPPQQLGPRQQPQKVAYATKLKNGEKPTALPPPGVQSSNAPVEPTGDYEQVNTGLEGDAPRMASFYRDSSRFYANLDHSSFTEEALKRGGSRGPWGSRGSMMGGMGSMMGLMGGRMGSMMGPMGGSMYGGNPMLTGSLYGGNPMMGGSMYGRGMGNPMMGSMYAPGSIYANGFVSRPASLFGSMYGGQGGSMYGGPQPGSMMGPMGPIGAGPSAYGMNGLGSMYGQQPGSVGPGQASMYNLGANQSAYQQPNSFYSPTAMNPEPADAAGAGPSGMPIAGERGLPTVGGPSPTDGATGAGNPQTGGATTAAAGARAVAPPADSKAAAIPVHVLLLEAPPAPGTAVVLSKDPSNSKCLLLGAQSRQIFLDEVSAGHNAPQIVSVWKEGPHFRALIEHVAAGHNVAIVASSDDASTSMAGSLQVVEALMLEAIARIDTAVKADAPLGYADAQLFCCSFKSATEVKDLLAGAATPYKPAEIGSNPLYGPGFMNMSSKVISVSNDGAKAVMDALQTVTPEVRAQDPVQLAQLVIKQVRNSTKTGSPDVLVSSVLAVISNAQVGGPLATPYFGAVRNEAVVPQALLKSAIGGACCTLGVLSVSSTAADPSKATAALTSLMDLHSASNPPPRSGSLVRFVNFAKAESDKLTQRPDANPSVLEKVSNMLKDGEALMANPRGVQPRPYPISQVSNKVNTPSTAMAEGRGIGPTPSTAAPQGSAVTPSNMPPGFPGSAAAHSAAGATKAPATAAVTEGTSTHGDDEKADGNNPIRSTLIVGTVDAAPQTLRVEEDGRTITDLATKAQAIVTEVVTRAADDWRTTESTQANELQSMFQNGHNTAIIGTVSPTEVNTLDKQPLWLSYKRMVSSLLSFATQKYTFAEVSLSMALIDGNDLVADLFTNLDFDPANAAQSSVKKLSVSFSPLFGPTVHKATVIKPPTPLQLESTINSALYQVPALLEQRPSGRSIIFASAVLKGVMEGDVYTCSLIGASTLDPSVFVDILQRKDTVPHELFEYAFGGPCCTLFLGDVNQGDNNVADVIALLNALSARRNRTVRACSVKRFVAFAEGNLKKFDDKLAAAKTPEEREVIQKGKRSMEVFHTEYKALLEDPEHKDPKTYRKGGSRSDDGTSIGSRTSRTSQASRRSKKATDSMSVERKRSAAAGSSGAKPSSSSAARGSSSAAKGTSSGASKDAGSSKDRPKSSHTSKDELKKPASSSRTDTTSGSKRTSSASKKK